MKIRVGKFIFSFYLSTARIMSNLQIAELNQVKVENERSNFSNKIYMCKYSCLHMDILEIIKERRSIRKFKEKEIKEENINKIIEAGIWAPSSGDTKPYKFLILKNREQKENFFNMIIEENLARLIEQMPDKKEEELRKQIVDYFSGIKNAPVFILIFLDLQVCADKFTNGDVEKFKSNYLLYNSLRDSLIFTSQNMLLQATELGLGSLYLEMLRFQREEIKEFFKLKDTLEFFACIAVGYADEEPVPSERKIEDYIIN
ncbi:MAG: nitroreductase family protein [Candidatus Heimdallarchaeaceae archaeon]